MNPKLGFALQALTFALAAAQQDGTYGSGEGEGDYSPVAPPSNNDTNTGVHSESTVTSTHVVPVSSSGGMGGHNVTATSSSAHTTETVPVIVSSASGNGTHGNWTMTSTVHVTTTDRGVPGPESTSQHGGPVPVPNPHTSQNGCVPIPAPVPTTHRGGDGGVNTGVPVSSGAHNASTLTSSIIPTSDGAAPAPVPTEGGDGTVSAASKVSAACVGAGVVALAFFVGL